VSDFAINAGKMMIYAKALNEYFEKTIKPVAKKYGMTISQAKALYYVGKIESVTVGKLAKSLGIACTNTSAMCKKLAHMGFLKRKRKPEDERVVDIMLTDEGKNAVSEIEKELKIMGVNEKYSDQITRINELLSELILD